MPLCVGTVQLGSTQSTLRGAKPGLVRDIGVVNLVHSSSAAGDFYPIDYRIYAPETDGKTKNDHFREMLVRAVAAKGIKAKTVLMDTWYGGADNLKLIHRLGLIFFTTLKENGLVSLSPEEGYIHPSPEGLTGRLSVCTTAYSRS